MNIENLKRAKEYIGTLKPEQFDMFQYRKKYKDNKPECNSVGCIIGHCTILDAENIKNNFIYDHNNIQFGHWGSKFFDITIGSHVWDYLFSNMWAINWQTNTIEHAQQRIQNIIDGHKPTHLWDEIHKFMEEFE